MADPLDTTTTSYSDPIYDRLEALSQRIRRFKWAVIGAIVLAVVLGIVVKRILNDRPMARSAVAFVTAEGETDPQAKRTALEAIVADATATSFFRARAAIEIAQTLVAEGKAAEAKTWVDQAGGFTREAANDQLDLAVRLLEAAVAEDTGDYEAALTAYATVERNGVVAFPAHGLVGALGAARVEVVQGRPADALTRLEPYLDRIDAEYDAVLTDIRLLYWQARRSVDGEPQTIADPMAPAPAPEAAPAPATETSAPAEAAPAGEAPAPAVDAAAPAAE